MIVTFVEGGVASVWDTIGGVAGAVTFGGGSGRGQSIPPSSLAPTRYLISAHLNTTLPYFVFPQEVGGHR